MNKKALLYLLTAILVFLSSYTTSTAFSKATFDLRSVKPDEPASEILWDYILTSAKLDEKTAALHNIRRCDCAGIFFDLDDDGKEEIIGTNFSNALLGGKEFTLFILKDSKKGWKALDRELFFNPDCPVKVLHQESDGYRTIEVCAEDGQSLKEFVYDKKKGRYDDLSPNVNPFKRLYEKNYKTK